jgi:ketosteroid isomerase-like protein
MTETRPPRYIVEEILSLERRTMEAIRSKDAKGLGRILADDFVYRTPEAEVSRADFLKNITALPGGILSVEGVNQRVSAYGETAVLTGVQKAVVRAADGVEHTSTVAFTDIFVERGGRWRLALAYAVEFPTQSAQPREE